MAIHHVVFIKFKPEAAQAEIDRFIEELNRLPDYNREVRNWKSGFAPEPRFHSGDFDYGLACDLADWDAMDRYMHHEGHLRMGPFAQGVFAHSLSFDFVTEFEQPERYPHPAPARETAPGPAPGQVTVPALVGRRREQALGMLEEAGLAAGRMTTSTEGLALWAPGRVIVQQPGAGSVVARGSAVDLGVTGEFWMKPELPA